MENEGDLNNVAYGHRCNILFLGGKQYFIRPFNKFMHICICTLEAFYFFFTVPYNFIQYYRRENNSILQALLLFPLILLPYVSDILFFIPGLPAVIWWIGLVTIIIHAIFIVLYIFDSAGSGKSEIEPMYAYKYDGGAYFSMDQVKEEYRIRPYDEGLRPKWKFLFPVKHAPMKIKQEDR